ncbi:Arm DNA-binding domain-containing protein [Marinomonas sp.]
MGSINVRSGKLLLDFRFKGERCREQTKLTDSLANKKRAKEYANKSFP